MAKAKSWKRRDRPPSRCLYAEMDVVHGAAHGEWRRTWNQDETWEFVQGMIRRYSAQGIRYLVILWDNAPWHIAARLRQRLAEHNARSKQEQGLRVRAFFLPTQSPWLMPLEAVFGQAKRAVGMRQRTSVAEMEQDVSRRLAQRNSLLHDQQPDPP